RLQFWTSWDDTGRLGNVLDARPSRQARGLSFFGFCLGSIAGVVGSARFFKELRLLSAQSPVSTVNSLQELDAMKGGYCPMDANWFYDPLDSHVN
ncbi:MAG: hypothetical protein ACM3TN_03490, partial [Alphaproteobacteria bacterium]